MSLDVRVLHTLLDESLDIRTLVIKFESKLSLG